MAPFGFGMGSGGNVIKLPGKASGGPVMPGGTYLVGEKGPELLHMGGAAGTITPNSQMGGGQVTYNINAVDAPSFQALVASDPGFIYAVTQAGARTIPGAR
jgi:phage-related minor tail protein